ncbi:M50 family metallopeptidase [Propioniciclava soli]|uniref:M50 family metallopeptidase n=1 Tax=Propioniciclava soli TaxID=2775081 RepID=A0ABZ3CAL3_9ACTN
MTLVWTIVFAIAFFALLMVSVALHEVGHMVPAKLFGVKVPRYFVGFGPTLWSIRRGGTEYGIKAFPLGGFVQLLGMYPPFDPTAKDSRLQRLADDARAAEWEDITPADRGRLFHERATWQKLIVMFGGPAMNLFIAFVLMWGVVGLYGAWRDQPVVASTVNCLVAEPRDDMTCTDADQPTPSVQAGLEAGDRIVAFNGTAIHSQGQLSELIRANMGGEMTLVVERDGTELTLPTVHTLVRQVPATLDPSRAVDAGWLGFMPVSEFQRGGPGEALSDLWLMTRQSVVALAQFPVRVWNLTVDLVTGQPRSLYDPVSIVGASAMAGQVAASDQVDAGARVAFFANLLAAVNLFLALFNLVPLPPLDGGHMAGALWEGVRRAAARLTGRPQPKPLDTAKMVPVTYVVAGFLLLCGLIVIVADIVRPMQLS